MTTPLKRVQAAWATGDPLALHREVEQLATEGHPRQALEDALEALLLTVRTAAAGDDAEGQEIAPFGGVYVTHMRSYTPEGVFDAMDEVNTIGEAGVGVHISHFNARSEQVLPRVDRDLAAGIDLTYDLYPYLAGSSILAMVALPPWVQEGGNEATLRRLRDPQVRTRLESGFNSRNMHTPTSNSPPSLRREYRHLEGKMLPDAAAAVGQSPGEFICNVLSDSELMVGIVHFHRGRSDADIHSMMRHPAHMAGSDGIFVGSRPHPRGLGRLCAIPRAAYVRDDKQWSIEDAVYHLAGHAARRFGLADRGQIAPGKAADIVCFDAEKLTDRATFEDGRQFAYGVEHVLVNGQCILRSGVRTSATPGRGLRRG